MDASDTASHDPPVPEAPRRRGIRALQRALKMGVWTRTRAGHDVAGVTHHSDKGTVARKRSPVGRGREGALSTTSGPLPPVLVAVHVGVGFAPGGLECAVGGA
jgi:hypothetical protein